MHQRRRGEIAVAILSRLTQRGGITADHRNCSVGTREYAREDGFCEMINLANPHLEATVSEIVEVLKWCQEVKAPVIASV
jgi:hypothetical protein